MNDVDTLQLAVWLTLMVSTVAWVEVGSLESKIDKLLRQQED